VQVRAGAPAGAAGGPEALARDDLIADVHAPVGEVRVERDPAAAECNLDHVPVALEAVRRPGRDHAPWLGGAHGGGAEDPDVDPRVPAARVVAERGGDGSLGGPG
jgi:hypothetical protein